MQKLYEYLKQGYEISPFYQDSDLKNMTAVKLVDLTNKELSDMVSLGLGKESREEHLRSYEKDEAVLFRCQNTYHYSPQDLFRFLDDYEKEEYGQEQLEEWSRFFEFRYKGEYVFNPILSEDDIDIDEYFDDYLFKDSNHIVVFVINYIRHLMYLEKEIDTKKIRRFIEDVINSKYSDDTLSLILQSIAFSSNEMTNEEMLSFYKKNLLELVEKNDYESMRTIGYEYYDGRNGFEYDPVKSAYYLEKCYEISHDPDLARTLGYIYYYGRTTNGVPQGDKAFQYFAIGHFAGRYYEATYKLADCYVKGYGTPKCYQAAYNLVSQVYDQTLHHFLNGDDSKFADVALRMASYYRDGIYVKKDLEEAKTYYLEARTAIKKRLEHMEYVGDRSVATGIYKSLNEINNELKGQEREVDSSGYIIRDYNVAFHQVEFHLELIKDNLIKLTMYRSPESGIKYLLHHVASINFAERCEKVEYLIEGEFDSEEFINDINKAGDIVGIDFADDALFVKIEGDIIHCAKIDKIILIPQTLKDITKRYPVVSVEFYSGSKIYDYLSLKEKVKVGDKLTVNSKGESKTVAVKEIKYLYEDELPLPYEKMGKAR